MYSEYVNLFLHSEHGNLFLQSDEACQQCLEKVSVGMMHMSNDAVDMEMDLLNEQLCPIMPWPVEDCKTKLLI